MIKFPEIKYKKVGIYIGSLKSFVKKQSKKLINFARSMMPLSFAIIQATIMEKIL